MCKSCANTSGACHVQHVVCYTAELLCLTELKSHFSHLDLVGGEETGVPEENPRPRTSEAATSLKPENFKPQL